MKEKLQLLKNEISEYINLAQLSNVEFNNGLPYITYINKYVFELQSHLRLELEKRSINLNLNPSIYSEAISSSMASEESSFYSKKTDKDLIFPFLYYLCENYNGQEKLVDYIEGFANTYCGQLTWEDIIMTQSGATRIYTNLRFALNHLRNLGLVRREDENGKSDVEPTVLGYLFFQIIGMKKDNNSKSQILKYDQYSILNSLNEFKDLLKDKENLNLLEIKYPKLHQRYKENLGLILDAFFKLFLETTVFKESGISIPEKLFKDPLYLKLLGMLNQR
jgi:hypothetical protein